MKKHFEKIMIGWTVVVIAIVAVATTFLLVNIIGSKMNSAPEDIAEQTPVVSKAAITASPTPTEEPDEELDEVQATDSPDSDEELYRCDYAYTTSRVNLRMQPSEASGIIMRLPIGAKVSIVKKYDDTWAKVIYQGKKGYITSSYLTTVEPSPTPIATKSPVATKKPKRTPKPTQKPRATAKPTRKPVVTPETTPVPTDPPVADEATGEQPTDEAITQ